MRKKKKYNVIVKTGVTKTKDFFHCEGNGF